MNSLDRRILPLIIKVVSVVTIYYSCKDEGIVGENFLGNNKLEVNNKYTVIDSVKSVRHVEQDISGVRYGLIGTYQDPVFGSTTAGTAFQLRILDNPNFADTMIFDSIKLFLRYNGDYGNISNLIKAKIYELDEKLSFSQNYKQDFDITPLLGNEIGSIDFTQEDVYDSIFYKSKSDPTEDSINSSGKKVYKEMITQMEVKLDPAFGKKLFYADPSYFSSGEAFLNLLNGICVLAEDTQEKGAIYIFDLLNNDTHMTMYYHYYTTDTDGDLDTINRTRRFEITENSATLNLYKHNASGTSYEQVLNGTLTTDSLYYLQGMAGSKLYFKIPELKSWKDSDNVIINEAIITIDIYGDSTYHETYPLPPILQLNALNKDSENINLTQQTFNLSNASSNLYRKKDDEKYYIFLFGLYLQDIINNEVENSGFELFVNSTEEYPRRVLLLNNNSGNKHIKVKITYTKI